MNDLRHVLVTLVQEMQSLISEGLTTIKNIYNMHYTLCIVNDIV